MHNGSEEFEQDSLGLNLETVNGRMYVTAVTPGFPAFRSGQVQVGDEILELQGIPVTGRNSEMPTGFKHALLGPKGSTVILRLCRDGLILSAAIQRGGYIDASSAFPRKSQEPLLNHHQAPSLSESIERDNYDYKPSRGLLDSSYDIEPRSSRDQQSKKLQELIGRSRLLHSNRLQEDINRCHADFASRLEADLAFERARTAEELEEELAVLRAEYEQRVADEVQLHREESELQLEERLRQCQAESQAALEDQLKKLRADGADKLAQQLGAERERLRAQLAATGSNATAL